MTAVDTMLMYVCMQRASYEKGKCDLLGCLFGSAGERSSGGFNLGIPPPNDGRHKNEGKSLDAEAAELSRFSDAAAGFLQPPPPRPPRPRPTSVCVHINAIHG